MITNATVAPLVETMPQKKAPMPMPKPPLTAEKRKDKVVATPTMVKVLALTVQMEGLITNLVALTLLLMRSGHKIVLGFLI